MILNSIQSHRDSLLFFLFSLSSGCIIYGHKNAFEVRLFYWITKIGTIRELPGGLVVRTLRFRCWGCRFNPWSGKLRSYKPYNPPLLPPKKKKSQQKFMKENTAITTSLSRSVITTLLTGGTIISAVLFHLQPLHRTHFVFMYHTACTCESRMYHSMFGWEVLSA